MPAGLTLSGNTISGTPTATGTFNFAVQASNAGGNATKALSITVVEVAPTYYTITLDITPSNSGNVGGGGTFLAGSQQTVTAEPNTDYTFLYWTENGNVVSTSASYSFTLNGNRTLVANFEAIRYSVTFALNVPDAIVTLNGVTNPAGNYTFLIEAGTYTYTIAREGYNDVTGTVTVTGQNVTITVNLVLTGIEEVKNGVKLFTEGSSLRVESDAVMTSVTIYNLSGQVVRLMWVNNTQTRIDNLPTGILVVRVVLQGGLKIEKALIK